MHINIAQMQRAQMECVYSGAACTSFCVECMSEKRVMFSVQRGKFFIPFFTPPAGFDGQHPSDVS